MAASAAAHCVSAVITKQPFGGFAPLAKALSHYSQFRPVSLTMQQYLDFGRTGTPRTSFLFLRTELLVRIANIMREFELLPTQLLTTPSARLVGNWYRQSFEELLQFERAEPTPNSLRHFNHQLRTILRRHNTVVETMAEAILEMKEAVTANECGGSSQQPHQHSSISAGAGGSNGSVIPLASEQNIQYFLDRFYLNRISVRMLQNQHLAIFDTEANGRKEEQHHQQQSYYSSTGDSASSSSDRNRHYQRHVGFIDPSCDVYEVLVDAYQNARLLAEHHYCAAPALRAECVNAHFVGQQIRVPLVPLHLYYVLFEVFKNSMRATIEHHRKTDERDLPSISACVALGEENLSIKISDLGGGVPTTRLGQLFRYMYSTAPQPHRRNSASNGRSSAQTSPFAGYGYGLPISRLYARYFLGDLSLTSMEGLGTDAVVNLKAIPSEASELLPVFGSSSRRYITMAAKVPDWITRWSSSSASSSLTATAFQSSSAGQRQPNAPSHATMDQKNSGSTSAQNDGPFSLKQNKHNNQLHHHNPNPRPHHHHHHQKHQQQQQNCQEYAVVADYDHRIEIANRKGYEERTLPPPPLSPVGSDSATPTPAWA